MTDVSSSSRLPAMPALRRAWNAPGILLVAVGLLLGLNFPLGKEAVEHGIPPLTWAGVLSSGSAIMLGLSLKPLGTSIRLDGRHLRYFCVVAVVSYALPNALVYSLIPRLGSGYVAMMFTLSPMFTVAVSATARLRAPSRLELTGVAVGFVGALLVATSRGEVGGSGDWVWVLLGLCVPVSLALGNVYRTIAWPPQASGLWLAVGTNAFAALVLISATLVLDGTRGFAALAAAPGIVVVQVTVSTMMFALFFRLQAIGGPVTLSQIGTVAAAVGVVIGTLVLGERYAFVVWSGVALIALGIGLTLRARMSG